MQQGAMGQNQAPVRYSKDKAFLCGAPALPGELLDTPSMCYFEAWFILKTPLLKMVCSFLFFLLYATVAKKWTAHEHTNASIRVKQIWGEPTTGAFQGISQFCGWDYLLGAHSSFLLWGPKPVDSAISLGTFLGRPYSNHTNL